MKTPLISAPVPLTGVKLAPAGREDVTAVNVKVLDVSASVALTWNVSTDPTSILNDADGTNIWGAGLKIRANEIL